MHPKNSSDTAQGHTAGSGPKPIEPATCYFRQSHPGEPIELVVSFNGTTPHMVYVMRPSLLVGLVRDGLEFLLRSIAPSAWDRMWGKKFDYPERL